MIDTIKVSIPLTEVQYTHIDNIHKGIDKEGWARYNRFTEEARLPVKKGEFENSHPSYSRDINWSLHPENFIEGVSYLSVELSLPKFWYGHNIRLLYDFAKALKLLKLDLEAGLSISGEIALPEIEKWNLRRLDICYAWKFPKQSTAKTFLDSLKKLHFPRKKPIIYPDSIMFSGTTYSVKFYLKYPEFRKNDLPELVKEEVDLECINKLEKMAEGVLRFEVSLRSKYLDRQSHIKTIGDLLNLKIEYNYLGEWPEDEIEIALLFKGFIWGEVPNYALLRQQALSDYLENLSYGIKQLSLPSRLHLQSMIYHLWNEGNFDSYFDSDVRFDLEDYIYELFEIAEEKNCSLEVVKIDKLEESLCYFLNKFLGSQRKMETVDVINEKLESTYKPLKAAKLTSFWLYLQTFGLQRTKEKFGHDSFYALKRDLNKAGVSIIETPESLGKKDEDFLRTFEFKIPSPYVVNTKDEPRDIDIPYEALRKRLVHLSSEDC